MGRKHINASATSTHDADTLYGLLLDATTWPTWSGIDSYEAIAPGVDDPNGVGAIRLFRTGRTRSREEVVEAVPGRRFSYVLLEGLPLKGYRADVDLAPAPGGGTRITWHSTFDPKVRGTGWLYQLILGTFIKRTVRGLANATVPAAAPTA